MAIYFCINVIRITVMLSFSFQEAKQSLLETRKLGKDKQEEEKVSEG